MAGASSSGVRAAWPCATARSGPTLSDDDEMSSATSLASNRSEAASSLKPKSMSHTAPSAARNDVGQAQVAMGDATAA